MDDRHQLFACVSEPAREVEQVLGLRRDDPALRLASDGDASPPPELQDTLVAEVAQRVEHGVGVHAEHGGHVAGGWETLARTDFALGDLAADPGRDLLVERDLALTVQVDIRHGDMHSSTMSRSATALRESPIVPDPEALIREARRRQRRRWTAIGAALVALVVVAVVAFGHHGHAAQPRAHLPAITRHAPVAPKVVTPAIQPKRPGPLAVGPDGTLYIADDIRDQILAFKNGRFRVAVGNGTAGFGGDGGLATKAEINFPAGMTFHDGTLYFADTMNGRVRAVSPFGIITTIVGNGGTARRGWVDDGTPALDAPLNPSAITFGPDGDLYVASDPMVLRLGSDGRFTRVVGNYDYDGVYGVGGPAVDGSADGPNGLAFDAAGNLYVAGSSTKELLMVDTHGTLRSIETLYPRGDGGLISTTEGTVLAMGDLGVVQVTPQGLRPVVSFSGESFHGVRGFSPNGITVALDGTVFVDTFYGNGYANKSAIAAIRPSGTSSLLWAGPANPGG